ncbi:MAG: 5-(carboxyamino)imidazole ribonucleotide synthase, partial [Dehalococcoidia bacterium]
ILDWPLGSAALAAPAVAMANVIAGPETQNPLQSLPEALAIEDVHVHLYQKAPRAGRKIGHVTVLGNDLAGVRQRAQEAAGILVGARNKRVVG